LHQRLEDKAERGHVLGREMLIACQWILIIEAVSVDGVLARMARQLKKSAKPVIKIPQILKTLQ